MSGSVRKPDEILPVDAASGAGRTPADRPAVCPRCQSPIIVSDDGELVSCRDLMCGWRQWLSDIGTRPVNTSDKWTYQRSTLTPLSYLHSPTGRQVAVVPDASDARSLCDLLNYGLEARRRAFNLDGETGREHVRNALEMLTNCGDDKYLIGNERRVVYDAGDIEAVKARLLKALGL